MKLLEYWIAKGLRVAIHDDSIILFGGVVLDGGRKTFDFCRRRVEKWFTIDIIMQFSPFS